eukprot:TRINITY_DN6390_c0_g1_i3.p1 TRINITY_DN6390_c0_g1~~TRINITY_DN6390_c0_g1_i3.p1  ORF type:complete len:117 (+),score=26.57 TRINITY_DN6390_c0_g1_i3:331-681(+)
MLNEFGSAPFTVQRLCELALKPQLYKNPEKYLFAIEKLVAVSSTTATLSPEEYKETVSQLAKQKAQLIADAKDENDNQEGILNQTLGEEKATPMEVEGSDVPTPNGASDSFLDVEN